MVAWLDLAGVDEPRARMEYARAVRGLDETWMAWAVEEHERRAATAGRGKGR